MTFQIPPEHHIAPRETSVLLNLIMKTTFALLAALFCAGCVSVPVIAKTNTGEKFVDSATATLSSGTFELTSARGVCCWRFQPGLGALRCRVGT